MNRLLLLAFVAFLPAFARSETLDLGEHGKYSITVPTGWKFSSQKVPDTGYNITLTPPGEANARCMLTLLFVSSAEPVTKERLQDEVLAASDQFVDQSVEKKKTLREFEIPGAYGVYCVFTDSSEVGKPPERDSFKVVGIGAVRYSDELMMSATLMFDDEKGPEFAAMLHAISSTKLVR